MPPGFYLILSLTLLSTIFQTNSWRLQLDADLEEVVDFVDASELGNVVNKTKTDFDYQTAQIVEEDLFWATIISEVSS